MGPPFETSATAVAQSPVNNRDGHVSFRRLWHRSPEASGSPQTADAPLRCGEPPVGASKELLHRNIPHR